MNFENSPYKVNPITFFSQKIYLSTSKSHANRALILGALTGKNASVENVPHSTDVLNLLTVFSKIGLKIVHENQTITFLNSFPECEDLVKDDSVDLLTGDGGTTNRFLIPFLALGKKEYRLFPSEKLAERPIEDLLTPLRELGVKLSLGTQPWLTIRGPMSESSKQRTLTIDCSKSTQFASALKLVLTRKKNISIEVTNVNASETYLKMSDVVIAHFEKHSRYIVPADFSSLSYSAVLAALAGEVFISNIFELDPWQADSQLIPLLRELGAFIEVNNRGLIIKKDKKLKPMTFDVSKAPDLFPSLVVLASRIEGISEFKNLEVLAYKESDRLSEMLKLLNVFDCKYKLEKTNSLFVIGENKKYLQSTFIDPVRDHRIVMAAALLLALNSGGVVKNGDCVNKSYPEFWELFS